MGVKVVRIQFSLSDIYSKTLNPIFLSGTSINTESLQLRYVKVFKVRLDDHRMILRSRPGHVDRLAPMPVNII